MKIREWTKEEIKEEIERQREMEKRYLSEWMKEKEFVEMPPLSCLE